VTMRLRFEDDALLRLPREREREGTLQFIALSWRKRKWHVRRFGLTGLPWSSSSIIAALGIVYFNL